MNKAFTLLVLMLFAVLACGSQVSAGIVPGIDGPTTGDDGGLDGDHPWGGDRTPSDDLVLTNTESYTETFVTGITTLDILIRLWFQPATITSNASTYRGVASTPVSTSRKKATATAVSTSSSFSSRKALK